MKIKFIGTGSAFCEKNFQTNVVIERNGKRFLIDGGTDLKWALKGVGLSNKDIHAIYVTHLHSDHMGGMEMVAFKDYFDPTIKDKPQLIANSDLMRELWTSLKGGLSSHQGKRLTLTDYFDLTSVPKNGKFFWEDIQCDIVQSIHIYDGYAIVPTFGLMIHDPDTGCLVFYPGDTQFAPNQLMDFYKSAGLVIQDCETAQYKSGVHAHYEELKGLPPDIKARMILVHYQDNVVDLLPEDKGRIVPEKSPISKEWADKARADGFTLGFAVRGSEIDTLKILGAKKEG